MNVVEDEIATIGSTSDENSVFVNKGLERWEKVRAQWLSDSPPIVGSDTSSSTARGSSRNSSSCYPCQGNGDSSSRERGGGGNTSGGGRGAVDTNVKEIIDLIVSNRWRITSNSASAKNKAKFSHPVPLPQMVDILVDLWEAEGLDV